MWMIFVVVSLIWFTVILLAVGFRLVEWVSKKLHLDFFS
jgi:hypothetical protein